MQKSRPSCLVILFLPILAILCLAGLLGVIAAAELPSRAQLIFGQPEPSLSYLQEVRLSAILISQSKDLTSPVQSVESEIVFIVQPGESIRSITQRLSDVGLIANPGALQAFLQYSGLDRTLQAGEYILSPAMTPIEIGRALQDATPSQVTVTVLPGWRLEEIAEAIPTSGLNISPGEFLKATWDRPGQLNLYSELPRSASLEGFLFPGKYELDRNLSAQALVLALAKSFEDQVPEKIRQGIAQQGLSLFEGVTLASIIQRETVIDQEAPMIASVYLNRLRDGIKLDADPSVQYALGYNDRQATWWTNPLSLRDLQVNSRYNTYRHTGLPPGPIANPGLTALEAIAFPADSPYYYFRATCDGSGQHVFAVTFAEHQENACQNP